MEYGETEEIVLVSKEDGTYVVPMVKDEYGVEYAPARFHNLDKWCVCESSRRHYCTNFMDKIGHKIHTCSHCMCLMKECRIPFRKYVVDFNKS